MKTDVRVLKIPGHDRPTLFRAAFAVIGLLVVIGPKTLPIVLIGLFFFNRLGLLWLERVGPPLLNQSILDDRERSKIAFLGFVAGCFVNWYVLASLFPAHPRIVSAVAFLVAMGALAWFRPSMAVVPILGIAAIAGSGMLLGAVPVVVMLARRDQRRLLGLARSLRRTGMTLLYALMALAGALLFANASAGTPRPDADASGTPASPTGEGSWFAEFSDWMFQRDGAADTSAPSRPVQVPGRGGETPPSDGVPWLLWIAVAVGVAVLVAGVVWFRRRNRRHDPYVADPNAALTLARLESIGAAAGRRRATNEGALTFATELAAHTGDSRLGTAGPLVSGHVYGSKAVDAQLVSTQLAQVEENPPPPPARPPVAERIADRVRGVPLSRRSMLISLASIVALGGIGWYVAPGFGDLREPVDRELAYVEQDDAPDEWHLLMGAQPNELTGWQTCSSGYNEDELGWATVGLAHRTQPLAAEIFALPVDGKYDGGSLSVGTDEMTAAIGLVGTGAGPSIADEPWRLSEWASVPVQSLSTVDAVLESTMVRDPLLTEYVDRNGDEFSRYESLAPHWDDVYGDDVASTAFSLYSTDLMRVVDIWTDDDGVPVRVRMIADGAGGEWTEWRRLEDVGAGRLALPTCESRRPFANGDWIGSESWTPSRSAPLLIEFDEQGNPYDSNSWSDEYTTEFGGEIEGPIDTLTIGGLNSISPDTDAENEDSVDFEHSVDLGGAARADITITRADGWPTATRIDVGQPVITWDEFEDFFMYESFIAAVTNSDFPTVELEQLDVLIEPLWDGETHVAASVDGTPGNELTIMTQSDASTIVVGRNDAGDIVSIVIWSEWDEWRQFGFEGTPPPSVLQREAELRECLSGEREAKPTGRCVADD